MTNTFGDSTPYTPPELDEPAPLVDEALAAEDKRSDDRAELEALRAEIAMLKESARETAAAASRATSEEIRSRIDAKPLKAAVIVAAVGFLYGLTR